MNWPTFSLSPSALLTLLQLCDTALPTGGFAFSNALETYTQQGLVTDPATLQTWLETMLRHTVHSGHLLPVALAYRETSADHWGQIEHLDQRLTAMKPARELRQASVKMGQRLLRLAQHVWPGWAIERLDSLQQQGRVEPHQAVVWGVLGCQLTLGERVTVEAAGYQWLSGMIAAALRLLPLGQSSGQRLLTALLPQLIGIAEDISDQSWDDIGNTAPEFEIRAMQHEILYSRLFQS